jgi:hypothetical protein
MRAREVPGKQTTVATAASVGEQVQKTARLFNPHRSPPIMWEGGEDESALKDIRPPSRPEKASCLQTGNFAVTERTRCTTAGELRRQTRRLPEYGQCP